eukprot:TRINITY_DN3068_c0_g1_i1.p1 TRINITY_DN3068_c0_g1~~TRINITY_DN3068_c0_g1_i1.p1  ORF type:complete len:137 (-),score=7.66 TRINITY_DN3068_c0_g1_i1:428-838(-)
MLIKTKNYHNHFLKRFWLSVLKKTIKQTEHLPHSQFFLCISKGTESIYRCNRKRDEMGGSSLALLLVLSVPPPSLPCFPTTLQLFRNRSSNFASTKRQGWGYYHGKGGKGGEKFLAPCFFLFHSFFFFYVALYFYF